MEISAEDLTANARHEAPQLDEEKEKETPSESPTEETKEEETSTQEDDSEKSEEVSDSKEDSETEEGDEPIPFHKHPRWIQRQKELEATREENDKLREAVDAQETQRELPREFEKLYGDDPKTKELYSRMTEKQEADLEARIMAKVEARQAQEQDAVVRQEKLIAGQVDALEEAGAKFDKNKLLKVMDEFKPVDAKGYLDFGKGYEIYRMKYPEVKKAKPNKAVAAKTAGADNESTDSDYYIAAV